jgi:hypothetical protein
MATGLNHTRIDEQTPSIVMGESQNAIKNCLHSLEKPYRQVKDSLNKSI